MRKILFNILFLLLCLPIQARVGLTMDSIGGDSISVDTIVPLPVYALTFCDYDGTVLWEDSVEQGKPAVYDGFPPFRSATQQYSYTFRGWKPSLPMSVQADGQFVAQYDSALVQYTVQFLNYDAMLLQSTMVEYGATPIYTSATPVRPSMGGYSYRFSGWNPEIAPVSGNVNYIAQFVSICAVSVAADSYGQVVVEGSGPAGTYYWDENTSHMLEAVAVDPCYEFDRWSDGNTEVKRDYIVKQPTSLTAQFRKRSVQMKVGIAPKDSLHGMLTIRTATDEFEMEGVDTTLTLPCGDVFDVEAYAAEDYHFVRWSDGSKSAKRRLTVEEGAVVLAEFAPNCYEYAQWPLVALYDWIIMLNVNEVNELGYFPKEEHVVWYRVEGQPDDMQAAKFPHDDRMVGTGFYLTIDRNMRNTGDYYCVVDVSSSIGTLCDTKMRSEIVTYSRNSAHAPVLRLSAMDESGMDGLVLSGINPNEQTMLSIYDAAGRVMWSQTIEGTAEYVLPQMPMAGCYVLRVNGESVSEVFRYIVGR